MTRSARAAAGAREPNTNGRIDMAKAFADICFTDSVRSAQTRYGSREANQAFEQDDERRDTLVEQDSQFIAARDSFYQATVSQAAGPMSSTAADRSASCACWTNAPSVTRISAATVNT